MPLIGRSAQAVPLERRDDVSCPQNNGTTYSANGYSWAVLCNYDFPGNDLPAQPATSLSQCIEACNSYVQTENELDGAACVAVIYNSADVNGNPCYLKSQINNVTSNAHSLSAARRVQYHVGDPAVFTSIAPSASSTAQQGQATSTSTSTSTSSSSSSDSFPQGAKIGVAVGISVAGIIIIALLLYIFRTRQQRKRRDQETLPDNSNPRQPQPPAELSPNSKAYDKPALLPHSQDNTIPQHLPEKARDVGVQELPSASAAAAELDSGKYHELSAGATGEAATELDTETDILRATNTPGTPNVSASAGTVSPPQNTGTDTGTGSGTGTGTRGSWKWSPASIFGFKTTAEDNKGQANPVVSPLNEQEKGSAAAAQNELAAPSSPADKVERTV